MTKKIKFKSKGYIIKCMQCGTPTKVYHIEGQAPCYNTECDAIVKKKR
jgi:hypothetical protein